MKTKLLYKYKVLKESDKGRVYVEIVSKPKFRTFNAPINKMYRWDVGFKFVTWRYKIEDHIIE